jgi:hypothetical protein
MAQIFKVMICCPQTKSVLDTGIRTSSREALNNTAYQQGEISCRFCGQFHSVATDAFLELYEVRPGDSLWRPNP